MNTVDLEKYINGFDQDVLRRIKDYNKNVAELSASVDINTMRKEYSSIELFMKVTIVLPRLNCLPEAQRAAG